MGAHPDYFRARFFLNTERITCRMLQAMLGAGVEPILVLLPSKESAYKGEYERLFGRDYLQIEERGYDRLCRLAEAAGAACLDLTPWFRAASAVEQLYFQRDPHWNERGHQLAAERIAPLLRDALR